MKVTMIQIVVGNHPTLLKDMKETRETGNQRNDRDHPHYISIMISLNAEKSPGDIRRLPISKKPPFKMMTMTDLFEKFRMDDVLSFLKKTGL